MTLNELKEYITESVNKRLLLERYIIGCKGDVIWLSAETKIPAFIEEAKKFASTFSVIKKNINHWNYDPTADIQSCLNVMNAANHCIFKTKNNNRNVMPSELLECYKDVINLMYDIKHAMTASLLIFIKENKESGKFGEFKASFTNDVENANKKNNGLQICYQNKPLFTTHMPELEDKIKTLCTDNDFKADQYFINTNYDDLIKRLETAYADLLPIIQNKKRLQYMAVHNRLENGKVIPMFNNSPSKPCVIKKEFGKGVVKYNAVIDAYHTNEDEQLLRDNRKNQLWYFDTYKLEGDYILFSDSNYGLQAKVYENGVTKYQWSRRNVAESIVREIMKQIK